MAGQDNWPPQHQRRTHRVLLSGASAHPCMARISSSIQNRSDRPLASNWFVSSFKRRVIILEVLIILALAGAAIITMTVKRRRFDKSVPLRQRIDPQAAELYDDVIYKFYPDTLVRDHYPMPGMKERALRKEDEEKFKCFLGKVAQDAGATTYSPNLLTGWPDNIIIETSRSPVLINRAWQTIKDCPPQFINTAFISSKATPRQRSTM